MGMRSYQSRHERATHATGTDLVPRSFQVRELWDQYERRSNIDLLDDELMDYISEDDDRCLCKLSEVGSIGNDSLRVRLTLHGLLPRAGLVVIRIFL